MSHDLSGISSKQSPEPVGGSRASGRGFPVRYLLLALLLAGLVAWLLWPVTQLEIRAGDEGRLVMALPVEVGDRVTYGYVHSVEKGWSGEMLEVGSNGEMVVRETVFEAGGRGQPSDITEGSLSLDPDGTRFRITNLDRPIPSWRVRVAFTAQQTLEVAGRTIRLDSLAPPTTLLTIGGFQRPRASLYIIGLANFLPRQRP